MIHDRDRLRHCLGITLLIACLLVSLLGFTAIKMANARILTVAVLIDSGNIAGYNEIPSTPGEFQRYPERYLEHLQVPYEIFDVSAQEPPADLAERQLILVGHKDVLLSSAWREGIVSAVFAGSGLVNLDWNENIGLASHIQQIFGSYDSFPDNPASTITVPFSITPDGSEPHFIAGLQRKFLGDPSGDFIYNFHEDESGLIQESSATVLAGSTGTVIAYLGAAPLITATSYGQGRAVQFGTLEYLKADRFGFLMGIDDLFWRSLVWAARKPFILRGYPRMWAIQMDDQKADWGYRVKDMYNTTLTGPVDSTGIGGPWKPTGYIMSYMLRGDERNSVIADIEAGLLEISPHSLNHVEYGDFFWNGSNGELTDSQWVANLSDFITWEEGDSSVQPIPSLSRSMVGHFWDISDNIGYDAWHTLGFRYITAILRPGFQNPWYDPDLYGGSERLSPRPFWIYERPPKTTADEDFSFFFADDLIINSRAGFPAQTFYLFTTQFHDYSLYNRPDISWPDAYASDNMTAAESVGMHTRATWRFWSSLAPFQVYTHDGSNYQYSSVEDRRQVIQQVSSWLSQNGVRHVFMDEMGDYIYARNNSMLESVTSDNNMLTCSFSGTTATAGGTPVDTEVLVFPDQNSQGTSITIPAFSEGQTLTIPITPTNPPTISDVTPNQGTIDGGTQITISGTNFLADGELNITGVLIGGNSATAVTVIDSNTITATTPAGSTGPADVAVLSTAGTALLQNGFFYIGAPVITSLSPNSGSEEGGTTVTITGQGFEPGSTVQFGTTPALSVTYVGATRLDVITPDGTAGFVDVSVSNSVGSTTYSDGFQYISPGSLLASDDFNDGNADGWTISPLGGADGWSVIDGVYHYDGSGHTQSYSGDANWGDYVLDVKFRLSTLSDYPGGIRGRVNPDTGAAYAVWLYPGSGKIVLWKTTGWNIDSAGVSQLGVASGITFDTTQFHLLSMSFEGDQITVSYDGAPIITATDASYANGLIALDVSNQAIDFDDIVVNTISSGGSPTLTGLSVTPASVTFSQLLETAQLQVTGQYSDGSTTDLTSDPDTSYSSGNTNVVTTTSTGLLTAIADGDTSVTVANGTVSTLVPVTVATIPAPPEILGVTPTSGPVEGGTNIVLTGSNFLSDSTVTIGGALASDIVIVDSNTINAVTPPGIEGSADIIVTTSAGSATLAGGFAYTGTPQLTELQVSPSSVNLSTIGQTQQLEVTGLFSDGSTQPLTSDPDTSYTSGGTNVVTTTSTGLLTAIADGDTSVTVANGTVSVLVPVTVNTSPTPPEILGVTPNSGPIEGGTNIVITGNGFLSDSTATIGGTLAGDIVVVDSNTINAVTPPGIEGSADIVVTTSAGSATLTDGFSYTTGTGGILFSDDFSDGDDLGWTISPLGNEAGWSVIDGVYHYDGSGHTQSYSGDPTWTDYVLDVKFKLTILKNYPGGIRGRVDPDTGTSYAVWLYPTRKQIILWKTTGWNIDSSGLTRLGVASGVSFDTTQFHLLSMAFEGDQITVSYDGDTIITVTDASYAGGLLALDVSNQAIDFDDIVVKAIGSGGSPTLTGISITPDSVTFSQLLETAQLQVTGQYSDGSTTDLTSDPETSYSSGNTDVITSNSTGLLTAVADGDTSVTVANGTLSVLVPVTVATTPAPPEILDISPSSGPVEGGTDIVISGTSFLSDSTVTVGGTLAGSIVVVDSNTINGVTPPGTEGSADIVVTTSAGSATLAGGFSYTSTPELTELQVSPNSVTLSTIGQTQQLEVTGLFSDGSTQSLTSDPETSYSSGNINVVTTTSTGLLTAVADGDTSVTVANGTLSVLVPVTVATTPAPPEILDINPSSGPVEGGTDIVISGTSFLSDSTVTIGDVLAGSIVVVDSNTINGVTPPGTEGSADIVVTTSAGSATLAGGFSYTSTPELTELQVSPNSVTLSTIGQTQQLEVTGLFSDGSTQSLTSDPETSYSSGNINVVTTTSTGLLTAVADGDTSVTVANGTLSVLVPVTVATTPAPPEILDINPSSGPVEGGTDIVISGTSFLSDSTVTIGDVLAGSIVVVDSNTINGVTPPGTEGSADIVVTTSAGSATLAGGFSYTSTPELTELQVSPNSVTLSTIGQTQQLEVTGLFSDGSTQSLTSDPETSYSSGNINVVTTTSTGLLTAVADGDTSVTVANGTLSVLVPVTVATTPAPPEILDINPSSGPVEGGTDIVISGTSFLSDSTVTIGDVLAGSIVVVDSNTINGVTPPGTEGSADIVVTTSAGSATLAGGFSYTSTPELTELQVSPNSVTLSTIGQTQQLEVTGLFSDGSTQSLTSDPETSYSSGNINVVTTTSTGLLTAVADGDTSVTVANGTLSVLVPVTVTTTPAPPEILDVNPSSGPVEGGTDIVISGSSFLSDSTVTIGDVLAGSIVVVDSNTINGVTPPGTEGSADLVVTTSAGSATLAGGFSYTSTTELTELQVSPSPVNLSTIGQTQQLEVTGLFSDGSTQSLTSDPETGYTSANTDVVTTTSTGLLTAVADGDTSVTVANGTVSVLVPVTVTTTPAPPEILDVSPSSGPVEGGTDIVITGSSFLSDSTVTVGGTLAGSIVVVDSATINGVTPPGTEGSADLVVTTSAGSATLAGGFSYTSTPEPTELQVSPSPVNLSTIGQTQQLEVTGLFSDGSTQSLTSDPETGYTSANTDVVTTTSDGLLTAVADGETSVTVANGTVSVLVPVTVATTPAPPEILDVSPSSGPVEGGTDIVITGSSFLSDSTVTVGGTLAGSIVVVDSATINAVTPTGTEGSADLVVTTSAGSATLAGGFSYTTGTGNILFSDNFSDGDALGWTISPLGNEAGWSVVSGSYSFDGSGHTQSYTGDAAWQNYTLQVDFQLDSLSNYPGGIRGRIDPATGAGYALWLYPADGRIILWRTTQWHVDSPGLEQLANASGINFGVGTQHTIAMNFTNNVIEVYFDGELQFTVVDDTLSSGLIALDVSNQPISFDNVVVTLSQ